jgi:hypothetical protein
VDPRAGLETCYRKNPFASAGDRTAIARLSRLYTILTELTCSHTRKANTRKEYLKHADGEEETEIAEE